MILIDTGQHENLHKFPPFLRECIYNGLDAAVTREVWDILDEERSRKPYADRIYNFERALQAPAIQMSLRGIRIHPERRRKALEGMERQFNEVQDWLTEMTTAVGYGPIKARSVKLTEFFYKFLDVPAIYDFSKGKRTLTCNRDALEKLLNYFIPSVFANTIMYARDLGEQVKVLRRPPDKDGRFRSNSNVGATETGRFSNSYPAQGRETGGPIHNIGSGIEDKSDPRYGDPAYNLRMLFIADEEYKMGNLDLAQAESWGVAMFSGDDAYEAACRSGDPHTWVAMNCFGVAEDEVRHTYYRHFTFRDMAKRGGHLTNYYGQPHTLSRILKVPQSVAEDFQSLYFRTFPGISEWHRRTREELQTTGGIMTPMGRYRMFFGRRTDDATLREALAYGPQSTISEVQKLALLRIWTYLEPEGIQLLQEGHDSILFQYPENKEHLVGEAKLLMLIPITYLGKTYTIPVDVKCGYDWQMLEKWESDAERAQTRPKITPILDRLVC